MSISAPLELHKDLILPEWIDYNGHLNVAYYVQLFDSATDRFFDFLGMDAKFRAEGNVSAFVAEMHLSYIREVKQGDEVSITLQLLDYDEKRFHYFLAMHHIEQGYLAATGEMLCLYVDMSARRVTPMPPPIMARLAEIKQSHAALPIPEQVGSVMKVKRN